VNIFTKDVTLIRLKRNSGILLMCIGLILLLAACTASASVEAPAELLPLALAQDPAATEEVQTEVEETSTMEVAPTEAPVDECLVCHLDKQRLIDTAEPEVVVASENEGEG
jgi:hypothetical protein